MLSLPQKPRRWFIGRPPWNMSSSPPPLLLSLLNKVRRKGGEDVCHLAVIGEAAHAVSLLTQSYRSSCLCVCVFEYGKIYIAVGISRWAHYGPAVCHLCTGVWLWKVQRMFDSISEAAWPPAGVFYYFDFIRNFLCIENGWASRRNALRGSRRTLPRRRRSSIVHQIRGTEKTLYKFNGGFFISAVKRREQ